MVDSQWLLFLVAAFQIQLGLIIAILIRAFIWESILFLLIGTAFALLALIPRYWGRFLAMLIWTFTLIVDFCLRRNPFSVFFIGIGLLTVYRMIRFWKDPPS